MENKVLPARKVKSKFPKKKFILPILVALTIALWPAQVNSIEANELSGVSPLAKTIPNRWGASNDEKVDLAFYSSDNAVGWSWSRQKPQPYRGVSYVQPIYPNARIVLSSPVIVGDIQSFNLLADFHYTQAPTGNYSLAYDIFLREPGTNAKKAEIMVVLDRTQPQNPSAMKGLYSDGINAYKLYSWTSSDGCAFRSFQLQLPAAGAPYEVNLKALVDLIKAEKNWYISEIELGTEVWNGSGVVELTTYSVELNGVRL